MAAGSTERTSGYFGDQTPSESKKPSFPLNTCSPWAMFCPGRVPAFSKKGWQISLEECGATLVNKATIKFTTDQHFRRK
jgi:hypothetical protein